MLENEGVKYAGYITDKTSANKAAWKQLQKDFPVKFSPRAPSDG